MKMRVIAIMFSLNESGKLGVWAYIKEIPTTDEDFELRGEFIVYIDGREDDLYRGTSFDEAMKVLNNT